jgi:hypothetical protein
MTPPKQTLLHRMQTINHIYSHKKYFGWEQTLYTQSSCKRNAITYTHMKIKCKFMCHVSHTHACTQTRVCTLFHPYILCTFKEKAYLQMIKHNLISRCHESTHRSKKREVSLQARVMWFRIKPESTLSNTTHVLISLKNSYMLQLE